MIDSEMQQVRSFKKVIQSSGNIFEGDSAVFPSEILIFQGLLFPKNYHLFHSTRNTLSRLK